MSLTNDWRGTPIEPGAIVIYHVQTRGGKTVEAEVVEVTEGDIYRGKTIMVRPLKESMIAVACPPGFYERDDKKLFAVPQLNVTVIRPATMVPGSGIKVLPYVTYVEGPLDWGDDSPCAHRNDPCEYCGKEFQLKGM